ncbi:MAG: hypothetical protein V7K46_08870 [Nostoc sp.]
MRKLCTFAISAMPAAGYAYAFAIFAMPTAGYTYAIADCVHPKTTSDKDL